jgi:hypothetical protein
MNKIRALISAAAEILAKRSASQSWFSEELALRDALAALDRPGPSYTDLLVERDRLYAQITEVQDANRKLTDENRELRAMPVLSVTAPKAPTPSGARPHTLTGPCECYACETERFITGKDRR